jgi:hypothetical protein
LTPALNPQLGLLGSPPDPVGRFTMREGPSGVTLVVCEVAMAMFYVTEVSLSDGEPCSRILCIDSLATPQRLRYRTLSHALQSIANHLRILRLENTFDVMLTNTPFLASK